LSSTVNADEMRGYRESAARMIKVLGMYGISDRVVLDAVSRVPRHLFIPEEHRFQADPYGDHPCPIGHGQTISQPFIVAYMTSMLGVKPGLRVLEVGTGCGYQTAVLLELEARVYSIELVPDLSEHSVGTLSALGYSGFRAAVGDGFKGWPSEQPFDRIIVSCAPVNIPETLVEQLADPGVMVLPVGPSHNQRLVRVKKEEGRVTVVEDIPVRFVPMISGGRLSDPS